MNTGYNCVSSKTFHSTVSEVLRQAPNAQLVQGTVTDDDGTSVYLGDGSVRKGKAVVDARGPGQVGAARAFQKFVGLELELEAPTACDTVTLMDARVEQTDGFRFVYTLPFEPQRILVEDTYYSDNATLDVEALKGRIASYCSARGLKPRRIIRQEQGVLPLPLAIPRRSKPILPLVAGYAGGFAHPTTGYSFPVALRLARSIAARPAANMLDESLTRLISEIDAQARYAVWLNRLLFLGVAKEHRHNVLERFYGLPEATIERFYALRTTAQDRARIVCGRPPRGFSLPTFVRQGLLQKGFVA